MDSSFKTLINKLQIASAVHYDMCSLAECWLLGKILISKRVLEKVLLFKTVCEHKIIKEQKQFDICNKIKLLKYTIWSFR